MKEARPASHPVVPLDVTPTFRFSTLLCKSLFWTHGSFCKILACNLIEILYPFTILLVIRVIRTSWAHVWRLSFCSWNQGVTSFHGGFKFLQLVLASLV
jgi:hypothetical protein